MKRNAEVYLNKRLKFEELISHLSATFVNLPPQKVEMEIESGLKLICRSLDADRCALMCHTSQGEQMEFHYSWISDRLDPEIDIFPSEINPKLLKKMLNGETFVFRSVNDIPENWSDLRDFVHNLGVKSAIIIPLKVGGQFLAGFTIDSFVKEIDWPDEMVKRLRFVGDVFANALSRKNAEVAFQNTYSELVRLKAQLEADCVYLQDEIKLEHNFEEIIGQSHALRKTLLEIEKVAPTDGNILILGETGTGKELFSRAIHHASLRVHRPMVKVNCAVLSTNLIESELFGHLKAAFTGAHRNKIGRFELANGGTIFLDEIGELPIELQAKLLRVIQEGEFERVGSPHSRKVDVRIIAATNRKLEEEIQNGRFRKDLWYRLTVFPITVPPLRDRVEDIPLLVNWFVKKFCKKHAKSITKVTKTTMENLKRYPWPGNVRELENTIERAVVVSRDDRLIVDLPRMPDAFDEGFKTLKEVERIHIIKTVEKTKWRIAGKNGAAAILDIHPNTLRARMKKLGIERPWHSLM
jgi:transcriptional regulator with GAF, ATPase, and Fis domain